MNQDGPLAGVRVLDFTRVISGPFATRILVELGADVVKVEPPTGDPTRFVAPRRNSLSLYFAEQNCGKRSISLDLDRPEAVDLVRRLALDVDVVVENFRPGVMDRMGLGYDVLAADNPRLVYAAITGYGPTGPWRDRRAYAPLVHAEAGHIDLLSVLYGTPACETRELVSHGDVYPGVQTALGVIAALYQRDRTGRGQRVDVSMAKTMLHANEFASQQLSMAPDEGGTPKSPATGMVYLATGDGRVVLLLPPSRGSFFLALCKAMGRDDLPPDVRFADKAARRANLTEFFGIVQEWVLGCDDFDQAESRLNDQDIGVAQIRSVHELASTEWADACGAVAEVSDRADGVLRLPSPPWEFADASARVRGELAYRGEHNRDVLASLGLSPDQLDALEAEGVVSERGPRVEADAAFAGQASATKGAQ